MLSIPVACIQNSVTDTTLTHRGIITEPVNAIQRGPRWIALLHQPTCGVLSLRGTTFFSSSNRDVLYSTRPSLMSHKKVWDFLVE